MNVKAIVSAAAILAAGIVPNAASAAATATAIADLNIRSGPGPEYPVIGAIRSNDRATVLACIDGSLWCQVVHDGRQGWAYSRYLTASLSGRRVIVAERSRDFGIPAITYETTATTGVAPITVRGRLIADPVGAAIDGVADAAVGASNAVAAAVTPPREVYSYVTRHPMDEVYLDGEVVVGAGLPETVELREIPDYEYRYVYVNRQPVLVEPSSRRIVYVYR